MIFKMNSTIKLTLNKIWRTRNENGYNKIGGTYCRYFGRSILHDYR